MSEQRCPNCGHPATQSAEPRISVCVGEGSCGAAFLTATGERVLYPESASYTSPWFPLTIGAEAADLEFRAAAALGTLAEEAGRRVEGAERVIGDE